LAATGNDFGFIDADCRVHPASMRPPYSPFLARTNPSCWQCSGLANPLPLSAADDGGIGKRKLAAKAV
jgi:hypothetical protein